MALVLADRVQETTNTTGTGTLTLAGASSGYRSFAAIGNGNTTYYTIVSGTDWEVGIGTYTASGTTLSRDTVLSSSAGGTTKINVAAGAIVFCDYPAPKAVYQDANGIVSVNNLHNGYQAITSTGGTTTFTVASPYWTVVTGTTTQTIKLPDATTLQNGAAYTVDNDSTGLVTVIDSASGAVDTIPTGGFSSFFLADNSTAAGVWGKYSLVPAFVNWGDSGADLGNSNLDNAIIGSVTPRAGTFTNIASATAPTNTVPALALTGTPNGAVGGKVGVLGVGSNFTASDKNIMASFVQSINDYTQIIVQNPNSGSAASADFVVNNDNTTGAGVYGDFGINSSTFSGTGSFGLANATYLYSYSGDLVIGSQTANAIHFVTNNSATDAITVSSTGAVTFGTALPLGSGGTGKTTAPAAFANMSGFTTQATAGGTTTLTSASSYYQVFTGTAAQTVQLPSTGTLAQGWGFSISNLSTNVLTINTSTSVLLGTVSPGASVNVYAQTTTGNTAADWDFGLTDFPVDSRMVPQNSQTGNYSITTSDIGKHIYHPAGAASAQYTIPANSATPFEIGTTLTFVNMSTNAVTIAITTDTMYLAGTGTTGSRTLAQYGMATALKMTATTWIISGSGLT